MDNKEIFIVRFDDSLNQKDSGACFTIETNRREHAQQIQKFLKRKFKKSFCHLIVKIESTVFIG